MPAIRNSGFCDQYFDVTLILTNFYSLQFIWTKLPPFVILLTFKLFSPLPALVMAETVTKYFVEGRRLLRVSESTLVPFNTKHSEVVSLV